MKGGGGFGWAPGEWTDDTSMALAIAETARGADLRTTAAQDAIVARWCTWSTQTKDIGIQTSRVLGATRKGTAAEALAASRELHESTGHTAGNGSLMRTAPVALAFLDDPDGLTEAAAAVSALTHFDPEAGEACVLWCHAIRHAVLIGALDIQAGLDRLPAASRARWAERLTAAEHGRPRDFASKNGWVVAALQAAWSAIVTTPIPEGEPAAGQFRADHLRLALENAVRGGKDTDTVAAIAGGLLGAVYGASAVPARWRLLLHGWPRRRAAGLIDLATAIAAGKPDKPLVYDRYQPPVDRSPPRRPGRAARRHRRRARPARQGDRGGLAVPRRRAGPGGDRGADAELAPGPADRQRRPGGEPEPRLRAGRHRRGRSRTCAPRGTSSSCTASTPTAGPRQSAPCTRCAAPAPARPRPSRR